MKIRDGLSAGRGVVLGGVGNAMKCGAPTVVCPAGHEITDVDDEGTGKGSDFLPGVVGALDLETAGIVLGPQDGEGAVVAVGASTELIGLRCFKSPSLE